MNAESVQELIGTLLVTIAWVGCLRFVIIYARHFNWRTTQPGRAMMYAKLAMLLILSYVVFARWVSPDPEVRAWLSLLAFAPVAMVQWGLGNAAKAAAQGKITADHPNYQPVRDWLARRRHRRHVRTEKK